MTSHLIDLSSSLVKTSGEFPIVTMDSRVKEPQGRGLSSLFSCCFKGSDQPEITYCHDNINTVAVLEPTLPIPPLQELDSMFTELVVSTVLHQSDSCFENNTFQNLIIVISNVFTSSFLSSLILL